MNFTFECPNCGSTNWNFVGGHYCDYIKIEPDEGWCDDCGFYYKEHVDDPLEKQILRFRKNIELNGGYNEKII